MKNHQTVLFPAILFLVISCLCCDNQKTHEESKPPNFVLIMADDLGYGGIGCYGNKEIKTPHLDNMAAKGIRFTDFYANSTVCTPTRAALLTGRYQQRCGLEGVIYVRGATREVGIPPDETTIAKLLKANGYTTGIMGKWHLGYKKMYNPVNLGFDEFYGYVSGNIDFHSHYDNAGIYDWWHNTDSIKETGYVTDLITQHSIDFIAKNKDKPFFLYVPHEAPHVPFQGRNDPAYRYPGKDFTYHGPVEDKDRAYIEMVEVMDEGIGKILATLRELDLEENTLVVFISDNGGEPSFGYNGELRGHKGNLFEGGIRVPGIAYWPGKIQPAISGEPIASFDWMPTFLQLSKTSAPQGLHLDGTDLSALLMEGKSLDKRPLFWRYRQHKAVREGDWKLVISEGETYLFNLSEDKQEHNNIASSHKALVEDLSEQLMTWEREIDEIQQITN